MTSAQTQLPHRLLASDDNPAIDEGRRQKGRPWPPGRARRSGWGGWLAAITLLLGGHAPAQSNPASPSATGAPAPPASNSIPTEFGASALSPLTNLVSLQCLSLPEAQRGYPVRMQVVVAYCHPAWKMLFVADGTNTTFFDAPADTPALKPGDVAEIEGTSIVANQHPSVRIARVTATGRRRPLVVNPGPIADILAGNVSCQWVELEGEVLRPPVGKERLVFPLSWGRTNLEVVLLHWRGADENRLAHVSVKVRGVIASNYDPSGQFTHSSLMVQESEQVSVLGPAASAPLPPLAVPPVLTTLEAALGLSVAEAQRGYPVKALVTVTYCHPPWRMLFVLGTGLGTYLKIPPGTLPLRPGDLVEIEGSTTFANGYPEVKIESLNPTGKRRTITPQPWSLEDILNGRASGQWIQIEGQVLATYGRDGRLALQLAAGATNLLAFVGHWQAEQSRQWLDARVRIRGVVSIQFDSQGQRTGVAVLAQEAEQVQVLQAAAASPLELPVTPLTRLTAPQGGQFAQRVHVQGVFEQLLPGLRAVVREGAASIQAQCRFKPDLPLDTRVDVLAFPILTNGELRLRDAVLLPTAAPATPGNEMAPEPSAVRASLPLLQSALAIRRLARSEAARGYPVRLEGVVTFSDTVWWSVFVQDKTSAIFVAPASGDLEIRPGQQVRVEGVTAAGDFSPIVSRATFTVLGEASMPAPARVTLGDLFTGQFDCQWVAIRGVIQSVTEIDHRSWLHMRTSRGSIRALLAPTISRTQAEKLVDARVTLQGVVGGDFSRQGRLISIFLHVPDLQVILVDEPAPGDPFTIPTQRMADLMRDRPDEDSGLRVKIAGRVTSAATDQTISLQDESGGMQVRLAGQEPLPRLGDQVELVGYPILGDFSITLLDARLRVLGHREEPPPPLITADAVLAGRHDVELVRIQARLLEDASLRPGESLVLQSGHVVFSANLAARRETESAKRLLAGSMVEVTGVCQVQSGLWGQAKSFRLLLRLPRDLQVLSQPLWLNLRRLLWMLGGVGVTGTLALGWNLALAKKNRLLREQVLERQRAEAALLHANETLEQRVQERTRELRQQMTAKEKAHAELTEAQQSLIETSRLAGMAEVATGVLHNVGNVLNSVNISCTLSIDRLLQSKLANLPKLTALLDQQQDHLGEFLTRDPKGKRIPGYLSSLGPVLAEEQTFVLQELYSLRDKIDHIKEIVAMQQSYARVSGITETLLVTELVEDALKLNLGALARQQIRVERQFEALPPANLEKHKILQILLNLIRNANHALEEGGREPKVMVLRVFRPRPDRLAIQVADNGVGISPENLTKIFSHGFTTRQNGHGFGLHSGALAAMELGGSLTVESAGLGHGATFTLELPLSHRPPS